MWNPFTKKYVVFSGHPTEDIDNEYYYIYTKTLETADLITSLGGCFYRKSYKNIDYDNELNWQAEADNFIINVANFAIENKSKK